MTVFQKFNSYICQNLLIVFYNTLNGLQRNNEEEISDTEKEKVKVFNYGKTRVEWNNEKGNVIWKTRQWCNTLKVESPFLMYKKKSETFDEDLFNQVRVSIEVQDPHLIVDGGKHTSNPPSYYM